MNAEKKVGIFFLVTMLVLGITIEMFEGWDPFEEKFYYATKVRTSVGLSIGDQVRVAGVPVGKVLDISLDGEQVRIDFYVGEGVALREDSTASIQRTNLLGGVFLGLTFGESTSDKIDSGSFVPAREFSSLEQLIDNFDKNQERVLGGFAVMLEDSKDNLVDSLSNIKDVTGKMSRGEGTVGKLINDPALYDELKASIASIKSISGKLERGEGTLGRLFQDPSLYDSAKKVADDMSSISGKIRSGEGTLGKLVNDDEFYVNANAAFAVIRSIADKANNGEGTLGKLINDEELFYDTKETMARVRSITTKIDNGQGTVGRLVNDDDLYRDAKTTLNKVEKAADGIRDSGTISALGTVVGTLF